MSDVTFYENGYSVAIAMSDGEPVVSVGVEV